MADLRDCPTCGGFFNYTGMREVCAKCAMGEDEMYEKVHRFLRRRDNRAATIERIVEVTGVSRPLLYKWVKKGRLQTAVFPNLGYPCDNCGKLTKIGKLCTGCSVEISNEIKTLEAAEEFREVIEEHDRKTYLAHRELK